MIPLIIVLPLLFAFFGFVVSSLESYENYIKATFLIGIFSPWPIFILNMNDYPVGTVLGGWSRISGIEMSLGMLNHYFILGSLIIFSLVGVYSLFYFEDDNKKDGTIPGKAMFPLILLLYSGILGSFLTRDLFNFYVYMEIASISSIILVACSNEDGAKRASYRYLILFFLSSFMFIFSIGIIYVKTGTLNFKLIEQNLVMSREIKAAIVIAFVAFITKAGIFPLYFWLPNAHSKADTPVSALLSGVTVKVPIFGMILFLVYTDIQFLTGPLMIAAFSSILFGIAMALLQSNVKKLLAYHTVSQMGYVLLGVATLNVFAAAHYAFAHTLFKAGLFLGVGVLISKQGSKDLNELTSGNHVVLMFSMVILTLAIGGVSPLIGAFGKHEILIGLSGMRVYLFYIGSIGTLVSFIKLDYKIFDLSKLKRLGKFIPSMQEMIAFIMALLTVLFGIYHYPKFNHLDLVLIGIAVALFLVFNHIDLFEKKVPRVFSKDIEGLGGEINLYAAIFVFVNISLLIYVLN